MSLEFSCSLVTTTMNKSSACDEKIVWEDVGDRTPAGAVSWMFLAKGHLKSGTYEVDRSGISASWHLLSSSSYLVR